MQPLHEPEIFEDALVVRATVVRRDIHDHGGQMRWTLDRCLPLNHRAIGSPNRSDLARTPGLARQPLDGVEAVRSFAHPRFESPFGAEASPHILYGVNIASRSPKLRLLTKNRFIVRRSLQHYRQAA